MGDAGRGEPSGRRALLLWAEKELRAAGVAAPRREAELLLCHRLGASRSELYLEAGRPVSAPDRAWLGRAIEERSRGVPLQHITGDVEFMGLVLALERGVFIPRTETEILVEAVLACLRESSPTPLILDVGTGCGAIAVSLAVLLPHARLLASDTSPAALDCARGNARRHGVEERITFGEGDLFDPFDTSAYRGRLDAIVSNPPYILSQEIARLPSEIRDHEPRNSLDGGPDGLAVLRRLIAEGRRLLTDGGLLAVEVGEGQAEAVAGLVMEAGTYEEPGRVKDYTGIERVVLARTQRDAT
jgi:release factor glutamine methyltransferase